MAFNGLTDAFWNDMELFMGGGEEAIYRGEG